MIDLVLPHVRSGSPPVIVTLGPSGTSSEQAARHLDAYLALSRLDRRHDAAREVVLFDQYEQAAAAVVERRGDLLVVANAYAGVSAFYMSPQLTFAGAYCFDTPQYGIASRSGLLPDGAIVVASHPAPVPLIAELLAGSKTSVARVLFTDSTSAAARVVVDGGADAALTTAPAAALNGLTFVTRTRDIRMLWSVFASAPATRAAAGSFAIPSPGRWPQR